MAGTQRIEGFELLAARTGFNLAVRHIKKTLTCARELGEGRHFADLINEELREGSLLGVQVAPMMGILLCEKYGYRTRSCSVGEEIEISTAEMLTRKVAEWTRLNVVLAVYPNGPEIAVLNPTNVAQWEALLPLKRGAMLVAYVGFAAFEEEGSKALLETALDDLFALLEGREVVMKKGYVGVPTRVESVPPPVQDPAKEAPPTPGGAGVKLSKQYSVLVTNELFHNGNVEAWKRIIESYREKHPGCDVLVWYDGERINDLNALFKWGKVKHGTPILFSVAGVEMKNISKLRKYLFEGASNRFEGFLTEAVGKVLDLF